MSMHVGEEQIKAMLKKDHPGWKESALEEEAKKISETVQRPELLQNLSRYAESGYMADFKSGSYSLYLIMSFRHCSYLEAVCLMQKYLDDPAAGEQEIFRS